MSRIVNLNDTVRIRNTPELCRIARRDGYEHVIRGLYIELQLWTLMQIIGPNISPGMHAPGLALIWGNDIELDLDAPLDTIGPKVFGGRAIPDGSCEHDG